jgi:membrane-associated protein
MEILKYFLHVDKYLSIIINQLGPVTYVILFLIIFAETGLVVTPFLPGDSLLFAVGTLAGGGLLNIWLVYFLILAAAILGDNLNYFFGRTIGERVFSRENSKIFNKSYLEKTRQFYSKYGVKTIILARFVPIVRTFSPFVAGIGRMKYSTFLTYSVAGGIFWVTLFMGSGYFLGKIPFVKSHFEYAVLIIILVSLVPAVYEYIKHKSEEKKAKKSETTSYNTIEDTFKKEHLTD